MFAKMSPSGDWKTTGLIRRREKSVKKWKLWTDINKGESGQGHGSPLTSEAIEMATAATAHAPVPANPSKGSDTSHKSSSKRPFKLDSDDLMFFMSLMPYVRLLAPEDKLNLRADIHSIVVRAFSESLKKKVVKERRRQAVKTESN